MGRNRIGTKHDQPSDTEHQSQVYARAWGFYDLRGMYKQGEFPHMKNGKC